MVTIQKLLKERGVNLPDTARSKQVVTPEERHIEILNKIQSRLPSPYDLQEKILNDATRFIVLYAGRRWGKTLLAIHKILRKIQRQPGMYWWVGLTWRSASMKRAWRLLKWACRPFCFIREQDKEIHFPDGITQIWLRTAENEESLAGEGVHALVFDEFTMARASAWHEQLRATLSDYQGGATFIGVPKGENWGYELFKLGENPDIADWHSYRLPTWTNPFIASEEIESARLTMPDSLFRQEYGCEILSRSDQVFSTDLIRQAMSESFDIFSPESKLIVDNMPTETFDGKDFYR